MDGENTKDWIRQKENLSKMIKFLEAHRELVKLRKRARKVAESIYLAGGHLTPEKIMEWNHCSLEKAREAMERYKNDLSVIQEKSIGSNRKEA